MTRYVTLVALRVIEEENMKVVGRFPWPVVGGGLASESDLPASKEYERGARGEGVTKYDGPLIVRVLLGLSLVSVTVVASRG